MCGGNCGGSSSGKPRGTGTNKPYKPTQSKTYSGRPTGTTQQNSGSNFGQARVKNSFGRNR